MTIHLSLTLTDDPNGKLITTGVIGAMKGSGCVDENGSTGDLLLDGGNCAIFSGFDADLTLRHTHLQQQYFDTIAGTTTPVRTAVCFYHPNAPERCVGQVVYQPLNPSHPETINFTADLTKNNPAGLINLDYRINFKGSTEAAPAGGPTGQPLVYDPRVTNKPDQDVVALLARAFKTGFVAGNIVGVAIAASLLLFAAVGLYFSVRGAVRLMRR